MIDHKKYIGKCISDRYTLVSYIGGGESSAVFGAFDKQTGQTVALKTVIENDEADELPTEHFVTEANLLALFNHPNIVKLLDVSLSGEEKYFVMEYIEGITLKKHIEERGALSFGEILFLSKQILAALDEVHKKGIVHCDIKPQNIVLLSSGTVKLMDFGISKEQKGQSEEPSEVAVGSVQYVSPEQAEGRAMSATSDIYSFGIMLYEMATGLLPFNDPDPGRIAAMQVSSTPIPPSRLNKKISPELENIILRCMEKLPEARFASASELYDALNAAKTTSGSSPKQTVFALPSHRFGDMWRRLNLPSIFAGVLCALLLSVTLGLAVLAACLSSQAKHGDRIMIPELVGESYPLLAESIPDPSVYDITVRYTEDKQNPGIILSQSPRGNELVRAENGKCELSLTVALRPLPERMPNAVGMTEAEALSLFESYQCHITLEYVEHNYMPSGHVLRSFPEANENSREAITLYIVK